MGQGNNQVGDKSIKNIIEVMTSLNKDIVTLGTTVHLISVVQQEVAEQWYTPTKIH